MYSNQARGVGKETKRRAPDRGPWTGVWSWVDYSLCSLSYKLSANLGFSLVGVVLLFDQVTIAKLIRILVVGINQVLWRTLAANGQFAYLSRTHQVRSWSQCWLHLFHAHTLSLFLPSSAIARKPFLKPGATCNGASLLSSARSLVRDLYKQTALIIRT